MALPKNENVLPDGRVVPSLHSCAVKASKLLESYTPFSTAVNPNALSVTTLRTYVKKLAPEILSGKSGFFYFEADTAVTPICTYVALLLFYSLGKECLIVSPADVRNCGYDQEWYKAIQAYDLVVLALGGEDFVSWSDKKDEHSKGTLASFIGARRKMGVTILADIAGIYDSMKHRKFLHDIAPIQVIKSKAPKVTPETDHE